MMPVELERVDVVDGQVPLPGMPADGVLFHVEPITGRQGLSPDRRRTLRQKADIERGVHPLTRGKARPELGTCGGCAHRVQSGGYPKCDAYGRATMTASAATDVRANWPACERFEARP